MSDSYLLNNLYCWIAVKMRMCCVLMVREHYNRWLVVHLTSVLCYIILYYCMVWDGLDATRSCDNIIVSILAFDSKHSLFNEYLLVFFSLFCRALLYQTGLLHHQKRPMIPGLARPCPLFRTWMATASVSWWWVHHWKTITREPSISSTANKTASNPNTNR